MLLCYLHFQLANNCDFLCRRVSSSILQERNQTCGPDERVCPGLGCLGLCPENSVWLEVGEFLFVLKWTFTECCWVLSCTLTVRYFGRTIADYGLCGPHGLRGVDRNYPRSAPGVDVLARCAEVPCQARKLKRKAAKQFRLSTRFSNLSRDREISFSVCFCSQQ